MTTNENLKSDYEATGQRMFASLRKEMEACEASRERYEDQDVIDRTLGALKEAQEEAENLWDGCNHMIEEANEAHDAAKKAFNEAVKRYGDDYHPDLWDALGKTEAALERAKENANASYKVYRKAEDTYLEAISLLKGTSQEADCQAA